MGCNNFLTEQTDKLIEASMRGENSGFSQETLEKVMPVVREKMAEAAQRELVFEKNPEEREIIKEISKISPEEDKAIEQEREGEETMSFRTLSGEFTIRQTPGSYLSADEVKRIYREETPQCVIQGMRGVAHINRLKVKTGDDGKQRIILGEHRAWRPPMTHSSGEPMDRRAEIFIYRHPKEILKPFEKPQDFAALLSGNQEEINQALAQREKETHYHEIGEEIYDTHLTIEEIQECDRLYEEAIKGGWMEKVCQHSKPTASEYFCDSYKMFKTDPERLKEIHEDMFKFVQNKVISLEVKDTLVSLEGKEE